MSDALNDSIETLNELVEDSTVPKNVKMKLNAIITILKDHVEPSIKVNKALHSLEEVAEDSNIQAYTRTQLWNIFSMLERV